MNACLLPLRGGRGPGSTPTAAKRSERHFELAGEMIRLMWRLPRRRSRERGASLDVTQVSELLGCSTTHVYDLCERGELPHYRDIQNAIRFDCRALGKAVGLREKQPP